MAIEPEFKSIRISGKKEVAEQIKAECKTDIPSDTVAKILDVSAFCGGAECSENGLKVKGTVIFNAVYCSPDGKVKKCECAQEFSQEFSGDIEGKVFCPRVSVLKTAADLSGTRLALSAVLSVGGVINENSETAYLAGGEEIVSDLEEKTVFKSSGLKKAAFPVEEEITYPYEVAEVLSQRAVAYVNEVQCGVGSIIIDGEVALSALLLQNTENGDPVKEEKTLPFRFEMECEGAMPKNVATAEVFVRSIRSDVSVDPESGKSVANVIVALAAEGEAFFEESVEIVKDAFSVKEKTEITTSQAEFTVPCGVKTLKRSVSGKCPVGIPAGASVLAAYGEKAEITSLKTEKGINIVGVFGVKAFYKDSEGKTGSVSMETPFEIKEEKPDGDVTVKIYAVNGRIRPLTENESEISGDVILSVSGTKTQKIKFVGGITAVGEKEVCDAAISVYIPVEGEGLFSLSKRLNTTPESLAATNKDLTFPLTGKERIVIYRKK